MTNPLFRRLVNLALGAGLLLIFTGCTHSMKARMDSAWERMDPMGHRRIHQEQDFVRGRSTGVKMPKDAKY